MWTMGDRVAESWSCSSPNIKNGAIKGKVAKSQFVQVQIQPVAGWGRD